MNKNQKYFKYVYLVQYSMYNATCLTFVSVKLSDYYRLWLNMNIFAHAKHGC